MTLCAIGAAAHLGTDLISFASRSKLARQHQAQQHFQKMGSAPSQFARGIEARPTNYLEHSESCDSTSIK